ncbi:MAG: MFS transporter [Sphaerochaetaceae bacterium]
MEQKRYGRNIPLSYGFTALMNLSFTHGLWMMYLASRGFSLVQLGILEATFHITSFLMEVPTGSVADIWGRKVSRLSGRLFGALSLAIMFLAPSFSLQVLGFVCSALSYNLESGAGEALLYDSLLLDQRESTYLKIKGIDELIYQTCSVVAFLIGGVLATINYAYAFSLTILTNLLAFALALCFKEPEIEKEPQNGLFSGIVASLKTQIFSSAKVFKETPRIAFLIVFSESLFAFIISLFFYLQNFWTDQGYLPDAIGVVYASHAMLAAIFSLNAHRIERKLNEKGILIVCPLFLALCLWGIALTPYSMAFYIILGCLEGLLAPTISSYLNKLIPSKFRATILSFQSMAYSLFMIMIFPLVGWIGSTHSLLLSFTLMAFASTLLVFAYIWVLIRRR